MHDEDDYVDEEAAAALARTEAQDDTYVPPSGDDGVDSDSSTEFREMMLEFEKSKLQVEHVQREREKKKMKRQQLQEPQQEDRDEAGQVDNLPGEEVPADPPLVSSDTPLTAPHLPPAGTHAQEHLINEGASTSRATPVALRPNDRSRLSRVVAAAVGAVAQGAKALVGRGRKGKAASAAVSVSSSHGSIASRASSGKGKGRGKSSRMRSASFMTGSGKKQQEYLPPATGFTVPHFTPQPKAGRYGPPGHPPEYSRREGRPRGDDRSLPRGSVRDRSPVAQRHQEEERYQPPYQRQYQQQQQYQSQYQQHLPQQYHQQQRQDQREDDDEEEQYDDDPEEEVQDPEEEEEEEWGAAGREGEIVEVDGGEPDVFDKSKNYCYIRDVKLMINGNTPEQFASGGDMYGSPIDFLRLQEVQGLFGNNRTNSVTPELFSRNCFLLAFNLSNSQHNNDNVQSMVPAVNSLSLRVEFSDTLPEHLTLMAFSQISSACTVTAEGGVGMSYYDPWNRK